MLCRDNVKIVKTRHELNVNGISHTEKNFMEVIALHRKQKMKKAKRFLKSIGITVTIFITIMAVVWVYREMTAGFFFMAVYAVGAAVIATLAIGIYNYFK